MDEDVDCAQTTVQGDHFSSQFAEEAQSANNNLSELYTAAPRRESIASIDRAEPGDPRKQRVLQALNLDSDEQLQRSHGAWLIGDVMCQGRIYLTNKAVYFHANLPYFSTETLKASTLRLLTKNTLTSSFQKHWFILRQDYFAWFTSANDTILPGGSIDLSQCENVKTGKDPRVFTLHGPKQYTFKADNANSAHDWVKHLTREIFRLRNSEPYVRVKIPLNNLIDITHSVVIEETGFHVLFLHANTIDSDPIKIALGIFYDADKTISEIKQWVTDQNSNSPRQALLEPVEDTTFHQNPLLLCHKFGLWDIPRESIFLDEESPLGSGTPTPCLSRSSSSSHIPVLGKLDKLAKSFDASSLVPTTSGSSSSIPPVKFFKSLGESEDLSRTETLSSELAKVDEPTFRAVFGFGPNVRLIECYLCYLFRNNAPYFGRLFVSDEFLCFQKLTTSGKAPSEGNELLVVIASSDVDNLSLLPSAQVSRHGYEGIEILLKSGDTLKCEFRSKRRAETVLSCISTAQDVRAEKQFEMMGTLHGGTSVYAVRSARLNTYEEAASERLKFPIPPVLLDPLITNVREPFLSQPAVALKISMLTIGSRGDVQPYIALAQGLQAEGHECTICSHEEYKDWVEGYGIKFRAIAGDPRALMEIMIDHGGFSYAFLKEASQKFGGWMDELLNSAWEACQGADVLIESPSAMAGIHIAEGLQIPYYRAFTMPWTRTRAYPHAFICPDGTHSGNYNYMTYVLFEKMLWMGSSGHINAWRKQIGLSKTTLEHIHQQDVPFLYCVSPQVLPPTMDQPDWIHFTGYWTMQPSDYEPPQELAAFIKAARDDKVPLVYIGFGSIVVKDPAAMSRAIIEAVEQSGVRAVLAKGWSARGQKGTDDTKFPASIHQIESCPHDWLFARMDAAVHHGGSGTTGASLGAGLPTIIKPFFGDQNFYSHRVEELGVGVRLQKLTAARLKDALVEVTQNSELIAKAHALGEVISSEQGVSTAIAAIYRELPYARSLIAKRSGFHVPVADIQLPFPLPTKKWLNLKNPLRSSSVEISPQESPESLEDIY